MKGVDSPVGNLRSKRSNRPSTLSTRTSPDQYPIILSCVTELKSSQTLAPAFACLDGRPTDFLAKVYLTSLLTDREREYLLPNGHHRTKSYRQLPSPKVRLFVARVGLCVTMWIPSLDLGAPQKKIRLPREHSVLMKMRTCKKRCP